MGWWCCSIWSDDSLAIFSWLKLPFAAWSEQAAFGAWGELNCIFTSNPCEVLFLRKCRGAFSGRYTSLKRTLAIDKSDWMFARVFFSGGGRGQMHDILFYQKVNLNLKYLCVCFPIPLIMPIFSTPPYDHPVNTTTLLLRPLHSDLKKAQSVIFLFKEPL